MLVDGTSKRGAGFDCGTQFHLSGMLVDGESIVRQMTPYKSSLPSTRGPTKVLAEVQLCDGFPVAALSPPS